MQAKWHGVREAFLTAFLQQRDTKRSDHPWIVMRLKPGYFDQDTWVLFPVQWTKVSLNGKHYFVWSLVVLREAHCVNELKAGFWCLCCLLSICASYFFASSFGWHLQTPCKGSRPCYTKQICIAAYSYFNTVLCSAVLGLTTKECVYVV